MTKRLAISELINIDRIPSVMDLELFLNYHIRCINCELPRLSKEERCNGCPWISHSGTKRKGGEKSTQIGCGKEVGELLGIGSNYDDVGRKNLFYFLLHPELNWRMPELPEVDFFGNRREELTRWELHHWGGPFNDLRLVRATDREHARFDAMGRRGDTIWLNYLLRTRERHPEMEGGCIIHRDKMHERLGGYYYQWKKGDGGKWILKEGANLFDFYDIDIGIMG